MTPARTFAIILASVLGAAGVAAAAASSHSGAALLGPLSLIALSHAPAILALALAAPKTRSFSAATLLLAVGTAFFCIDLSLRFALGHCVIPMLAPVSGAAMIIGWLALAIAAVISRRI